MRLASTLRGVDAKSDNTRKEVLLLNRAACDLELPMFLVPPILQRTYFGEGVG
jgi:hypothetical protein